MGNDSWVKLTVEAPSDDSRDLVAEGLLALGGTAVQDDGSTLTTYITPPDDLPAWLEDAHALLRALSGVADLAIEWSWQAGEDWAETWKRGLQPRRVGRRFVVTPSWAAYETRPDDLLIVIDPEMAFGTGEHATTRAALRFLEQVVQPGQRVLDVGTGSGILAIGAALLGAREVIAVDSDPDAILNARDNIARNKVSPAVRLEQRAVDSAYLAYYGAATFDVIAANVLSRVLVPLLASFADVLRPDGHLILGGILETDADDMLEACGAVDLQVIAEDLDEEWWGVLLRRPPRAPS